MPFHEVRYSREPHGIDRLDHHYCRIINGLSAGLYTRMTLQSVERILPTILLDQLQALSLVSEELSG